MGSKPPRFSQLLPIATAVHVPWGLQRDAAALELLFLLFSLISRVLLIFSHGKRHSLSKNINISGISHRSRLQMKPDGS